MEREWKAGPIEERVSDVVDTVLLGVTKAQILDVLDLLVEPGSPRHKAAKRMIDTALFESARAFNTLAQALDEGKFDRKVDERTHYIIPVSEVSNQ